MPRNASFWQVGLLDLALFWISWQIPLFRKLTPYHISFLTFPPQLQLIPQPRRRSVRSLAFCYYYYYYYYYYYGKTTWIWIFWTWIVSYNYLWVNYKQILFKPGHPFLSMSVLTSCSFRPLHFVHSFLTAICSTKLKQ